MQLTYVSLIVRNQEEALAFYTGKLGFEKKDDAPMGEDRWLTIQCPGQGVEIVLQMPHWGGENASTKEREAQIGKQTFYFFTPDIEKTYMTQK